jgi:hypothetical protein
MLRLIGLCYLNVQAVAKRTLNRIYYIKVMFPEFHLFHVAILCEMGGFDKIRFCFYCKVVCFDQIYINYWLQFIWWRQSFLVEERHGCLVRHHRTR